MDVGLLYLDLLEQRLCDAHGVRDIKPVGWKRRVVEQIRKRGYRVVVAADTVRATGRDWPATAETMIGLRRLRNFRECIETVIADDVPGDIIEAGVWRGGACIYARAILAVHDVTDRTVWLADSFEGLPPPTLKHDAGLDLHLAPELAVNDREVRANFERYGLLDEQVRFIKGWFRDTLPGPVDHLAVLRLDGDLYESTWDATTALEPMVSAGGFVIVDDFGSIPSCARAIHDYRSANGIDAPIIDIDGAGVYWRKPFPAAP